MLPLVTTLNELITGAALVNVTATLPVLPVAERAVTVAVPAVVPRKLTEAWPLASVVADAADKVPRFVAKVTTWPGGNRLPFASRTVAVMVLAAEPFATMLVGLADSPTTVAVDASATSWTVAETVFAETVDYANAALQYDEQGNAPLFHEIAFCENHRKSRT